jgi:hypothetical protein
VFVVFVEFIEFLGPSEITKPKTSHGINLLGPSEIGSPWNNILIPQGESPWSSVHTPRGRHISQDEFVESTWLIS